MRAVAAAVVAGLFTIGAAADTFAPRPVATTGEIMNGLVTPSSTAIFKAAAEAPADAAGWEGVRMQALLLAESANLLMIGSRARNADEWMRMAAAMRDAAEVTVKAATGKSATALEESGEKLYETCESCHLRYLPQ